MSEPVSATRLVAVAVHTLGCKVNRVESDSIAAQLLGTGTQLVPESEAEVIIVNTCTVTREADAKARKAVRQALRAPREPVVVVTGCLAALEPDALRSLGERVVIETDKSLVAQRVIQLLELEAVPADEAPMPVIRAGEGFRTRALLKIEDGCDNFCTYCIVPAARGVPRGVPLVRAVGDASALVDAGASEIVLTGINIGRYRDPETGEDLSDLISAVADTGVLRLRLSSIEPPELTDRLLSTLARTRAVCEHLHVPLQSGSDTILAAMGRKYTAEQYAERIAAAHGAIAGLAVTTDVIAGFPGETDDEHAETMRFVERVGFSRLHVFRYSERPGTPAASMPQVQPTVRASRAAELRALGERLRGRAVAARMSRSAEVLFETVGEGFATGTTRDYLRVRVPASGVAPGDVRDVSFTAGDVTLS